MNRANHYLTLYALMAICQSHSCSDFYQYKLLNIQDKSSSYLNKNKHSSQASSSTVEEIPRKDGFLVIPFLSKAQILQIKDVNLNAMDVDQEFYARGVTDYDYILPLCVNNQTFLSKLDLSMSLIYVASQELNYDSYSKHYPANSVNHELLYSHYGKCLDTQSISNKNSAYSSTQKYKPAGSTKCLFDYYNQYQNYSISGDFILDEITFHQQNLKSTSSKLMLGLVKDQNSNFIYKNINGIIGLGSINLDHSYSESLLTKLVENLNLNAEVFSICLNSNPEEGGYMIIGGADNSLYESSSLSWVSYSKVEETASYLSSMTFNGHVLGKRLTVKYETSIPNITVSEDVMNQIVMRVQEYACEKRGMDSIKGLCTQVDDRSNIFKGNAITVPESQEHIMASLPPIILNFKRDGVDIEITNYIQRCLYINPQFTQTNQWCSILTTFSQQSSITDTVVLGSQFLRSFYVIFDQQLSRIGFAQKKTQFCDPENSDDYILINDNNNIRLAVNVLLIAFVIVIAVKVTGGCLQFFDFGSSSPSQGSQSQRSPNPQGNQQNAHEEEDSSQAEESTINNSGVIPNHMQNISNLNNKLTQEGTGSGGAVNVQQQQERHVTQTFRIDDKNDFN